MHLKRFIVFLIIAGLILGLLPAQAFAQSTVDEPPMQTADDARIDNAGAPTEQSAADAAPQTRSAADSLGQKTAEEKADAAQPEPTDKTSEPPAGDNTGAGPNAQPPAGDNPPEAQDSQEPPAPNNTADEAQPTQKVEQSDNAGENSNTSGEPQNITPAPEPQESPKPDEPQKPSTGDTTQSMQPDQNGRPAAQEGSAAPQALEDATSLQSSEENAQAINDIPDTDASLFEVTPYEGGVYIKKYTGTALQTVKVPATIGEKSVKGIGPDAFAYNTFITSVILPDGITAIFPRSFYGCNSLTSINIPETVTAISESAFAECKGLTTVTLPSSIKIIGAKAFSGCTALKNINIPVGVTKLYDSVFSNCVSLQTITLPSALTEIGGYTFSFSGLTSVIIPSSVTSIGWGAFASCALLKNVTLPTALTEIAGNTFSSCRSLEAITIPMGVTSIGEFAFSDNSKLASVTIPSTVTAIGKCAFYNCTALNNITLPQGITEIAFSTFDGCSSLGSITIPAKVEKIGQQAFGDCKSLTNVMFEPNSNLTEMGVYAFNRCKALTKIELPTKLISIPNYAFSKCEALADVTLPATLNSIGTAAFNNCVALPQILIPKGVESIGVSAFQSCFALKSVEFRPYSNLKTIGDQAFSWCSKLEKIDLPQGLESVGDSAFGNCLSLTNLVMPTSLKFLGNAVVEHCENLKYILFNGNAAPEPQSGGESSLFGTSKARKEYVTLFKAYAGRTDGNWRGEWSRNLEEAASGGAKASTISLAKTEGSVNVTDAENKDVPVRLKMKLYDKYHISTLNKSYAWLDCDSTKLIKLNENSKAVINKTGKKLEIDVSEGKLFFNITEPLKDDESLNIRTATMAVGIRGTSGWVDVKPDGTTQLGVLEGNVALAVTDSLGYDIKQETVTSGQKLDVRGSNAVKTTLTKQEIAPFVAEEVKGDNALSQKIYDKTGGALDLRQNPIQTSNPTQNPQPSNPTQNPQQGGKPQNPQPSNPTQNPQQGDKPQSSQPSNPTRNPQQSGNNPGTQPSQGIVKPQLPQGSPNAPTGLYASKITDTSIMLKWNKLTGAKKYDVQRSLDGVNYTTVKLSSGNSLTNSKLAMNTNYYYRIGAKLKDGSFTGYSTPIHVKTIIKAPKAPTGAKATADGYSVVNLRWKAVPGVSGYRIMRSENGAPQVFVCNTVSADHTDMRLTQNTKYTYYIQAYVNADDGAQTLGKAAKCAVKTKSAVPNAPSGVKAVADGADAVNLSWKPVAGASGYEVYRGTDKLDMTLAADITGTAYSQGGLAAQTKYIYGVKAYTVLDGVKIYGKTAFKTVKTAKAAG